MIVKKSLLVIHVLLSFFQDELVAVSEKAVLKVSDLLDWFTDPAEVKWDRGLKVSTEKATSKNVFLHLKPSKEKPRVETASQ